VRLFLGLLQVQHFMGSPVVFKDAVKADILLALSGPTIGIKYFAVCSALQRILNDLGGSLTFLFLMLVRHKGFFYHFDQS
jgi:hypothetical protein